MATLTLGPAAGIANNVVQVDVAGNTGAPARFSASAEASGDPAETRVSGVVLDNTDIPIEGVTVTLEGTAIPPVQTNVEGQFVIQPAPVGNVMLHVDGSTALRPGAWASLEFELVTIPGWDNTTGRPIYLLPLDVPNGLQVSETVGGTITLSEIPGFSLTVEAGSATFPGGGQSGVVSVTVVHADKVPMVPNFGQQPRLVVTIQPPGVIFDPPARVTYPNLDGLAPGEITELYSFDHDMGTFVAIGTGSVSEDGTVIESDPGVGILKGGWQCAGTPQQTGQCQNVAVRLSQTDLTVHVGETLQLSATGTPNDPGTPAYAWSVSDDTFFSLAFADGNSSQTHPSNTVDITGLKETEAGADQKAFVTFMTAQTNQSGQPLTANNAGNIRVKCPLDSIVWEAIDSALTTNTNEGGGMRIFPGKQTPGDGVDRQTVRARAQIRSINPDSSGVKIFFRAFDVDDPTNDQIVDSNGTAGDDNRGMPIGVLSSAMATTDTTGKAVVDFTVTFQPGDNFKIAAACSEGYLSDVTVDGTDLKDQDGEKLPTDRAAVTDMLTVWRKVHVETDVMARPTIEQNSLSGLVEDVTLVQGITGYRLVIDHDFSQDDEYAGGTLRSLVTNTNYIVASNKTRLILNDVVTVVRKLLTPAPEEGPYIMVDDDVESLPSQFGSRDILKPLDLSTAEASFRKAYVEVVSAGPQNAIETIPFVLHIPFLDDNGINPNLLSAASAGRDLPSREDFWSIVAASCFQPGTLRDHDGESEILLGEAASLGGGVACVYMETLRESTPIFSTTEALVAAHEIGHALGAAHEDGTLLQAGEAPSIPNLGPATIATIRDLMFPQ